MSQDNLMNPKSDQLEIINLFGGPGTGKTTTAVGNTDIENFKGILQRMFDEQPAENLMLIAYTRSAADEAKDRLYKLTDVNKSVLDNRITTIHSLTMGMTGIRPNSIVEIRNPPDKYNFCRDAGLHYETGSSDDDIMDVPDDEGHLFFQILSWLKSNMKPVSEWEDCPISSSWPQHREEVDDEEQPGIEYLSQQWEGWKDNRNIYEFDDVIRLAVDRGYTIDARELFIDEVQDLYPLQQAFVDNQKPVIDRLWLSGDDDQTIYEWAGANPEYFINTEGSVENEDWMDGELWSDKSGYWENDGTFILNQSYRMPSKVLELSQMCIEQVDNRQDKEIKPISEGGVVDRLQYPNTQRLVEHINFDDTFILCRANFQANNVNKQLIYEGIPFKDRFKTWRESTVKLRDAVRALWKNEPMVDSDAAHQLVSEVETDALKSGAQWGDLGNFSGTDMVETERLAECLKRGAPTTRGNLNSLIEKFEDKNYFQKEAIKNNVTGDYADMDPEGITIETIHWSKGQEADTVILSLSTTNAVLGSSEKPLPDAERRLMYVGMTRSKNKLVLAEGLDTGSPTFTCDQLFQEGWEEIVNE